MVKAGLRARWTRGDFPLRGGARIDPLAEITRLYGALQALPKGEQPIDTGEGGRTRRGSARYQALEAAIYQRTRPFWR